MEAERRFNRYVAVDGNLSYAQPHGSSDTDITDSTLARQPRHLTPWNGPDVHLQFTIRANMRAQPGDRDNMTAYTTADLAIDGGRPATDPALGIAQPGRHAAPLVPADYVDDFPRRGRTLWLGLAYQSSAFDSSGHIHGCKNMIRQLSHFVSSTAWWMSVCAR